MEIAIFLPYVPLLTFFQRVQPAFYKIYSSGVTLALERALNVQTDPQTKHSTPVVQARTRGNNDLLQYSVPPHVQR